MPKHVVVHYTVIKYTSCDTVVFDYIPFSKNQGNVVVSWSRLKSAECGRRNKLVTTVKIRPVSRQVKGKSVPVLANENMWECVDL